MSRKLKKPRWSASLLSSPECLRPLLSRLAIPDAPSGLYCCPFACPYGFQLANAESQSCVLVFILDSLRCSFGSCVFCRFLEPTKSKYFFLFLLPSCMLCCLQCRRHREVAHVVNWKNNRFHKLGNSSSLSKQKKKE